MISESWPLIAAALTECGQGSRASQAAALATVAIETASTFRPVREAFWLSEEWRKGNLRYWPYYGRGFIQITWVWNYARYSGDVGFDLVQSPDRAMEPQVAAKILAAYWASHNIQRAADVGDWTEVRRLVQGGSAGLDRLTHIAAALLS